MLTHEQVEAHFAALGDLVPVASLSDDALNLPAGVDVFIPDCHVLTPADSALFPKSAFRQAEGLEAFLKRLHELQQAAGDGAVQVWHVGDIFDIWRASPAGDPAAAIDGICGAYPTLFNLLTFSSPGGLEAEILAGNHDYHLFDTPGWEKARFRIVGDATAGQMMVLHGDVFDWLERLPDAVQEFAVRRLGQGYAGQEHHLFKETQDEAVQAVNAALPVGDVPVTTGAAALGAAAGMAVGAAGARNVLDGVASGTKFYRHARKLAELLNTEHGCNIRLMVIGHTHFARIARGTLDDGGPFVLMDCGAWLDRCILPGEAEDAPVLCAQFGVRIGNEVRLYQVGRTPWHAP